MTRMGNEGSAQDVREQATEAAQNIRDAAREKYEELSEQARHYYDQGRDMAREWEEGLESYVREKPLQAVLIAAGIGLVLGMLWKRS